MRPVHRWKPDQDTHGLNCRLMDGRLAINSLERTIDYRFNQRNPACWRATAGVPGRCSPEHFALFASGRAFWGRGFYLGFQW